MTRTGQRAPASVELGRDTRSIIDGHRVDGSAGSWLEIRSPRDGSRLATQAECGVEDVDRAVRAARADFRSGRWCQLAPCERANVLTRWAAAVADQRDELAGLLTRETGKPVTQAEEGDIPGLVGALNWYASIADKLAGRHPEVGPADVAFLSHEPIGVVGVVMPWNFPLALIGYDVAPALMIGNSVLVKPSEQASLVVLRVCELALEAGVPSGTLQVLSGSGKVTGQALSGHHDVDSVTVTGSESSGRAVMQAAATSNGKRVWPELGGKSGAIVLPDAACLSDVAASLAWGATFNQGEMCTGVMRVLVHEDVYERLLAELAAHLAAYRIGDPLDPATTVGALTSYGQLDDALASVRGAVAAGAEVVCGGQPIEIVEGGNYLEPTLIRDTPVHSRFFTEEVFAPVIATRAFTDLSEAMEIVAASGYGMGLSLWTSDIDRAFVTARQSPVGTCWINCFEADDMTVPAGGNGRSGFGRTKGEEVVAKYSNTKTTWIKVRNW